MAGHTSIWGLDIGLSALKALKLSYDADSDELYAEELDYIEHAKILSQPDADPDQLIATTLETWVSIICHDGLSGECFFPIRLVLFYCQVSILSTIGP